MEALNEIYAAAASTHKHRVDYFGIKTGTHLSS